MNAPPENYDDWKQCITVDCGIPLTLAYVEQRLAALRNPKEYGTKRFTELYGEAYLGHVIGWFEQAKRELE